MEFVTHSENSKRGSINQWKLKRELVENNEI